MCMFLDKELSYFIWSGTSGPQGRHLFSDHSYSLNSWKYQKFRRRCPWREQGICPVARSCTIRLPLSWTCNSTSINYQKPWVLSEEPQISSKGSSKITSRSSSRFSPKRPLHQESQDRCPESSPSVGSLQLSSSAG